LTICIKFIDREKLHHITGS